MIFWNLYRAQASNLDFLEILYYPVALTIRRARIFSMNLERKINLLAQKWQTFLWWKKTPELFLFLILRKKKKTHHSFRRQLLKRLYNFLKTYHGNLSKKTTDFYIKIECSFFSSNIGSSDFCILLTVGMSIGNKKNY